MSRYIDADALIKHFDAAEQIGFGIIETAIVKDFIINEPTADVVEVVHGKWIPSRFKTLQEDGWCECSVCGVGNKLYDRGVRRSDVPYIDGKPYELKNIANYCSNCGAKMERREDEEIH